MSHGNDGAGEPAPRPNAHYLYRVQPLAGSLGETLRRDREANNLTQVEAAAAAGFQQGKLSAYELGRIKNPPPDRLKALEKLYGRPVGYYIDLAGYPESAAMLRELERLDGALVVENPRAGLNDLIGILTELSDPAFQHVITVAEDQLRVDQRRAAAAADSPTVRDSA